MRCTITLLLIECCFCVFYNTDLYLVVHVFFYSSLCVGWWVTNLCIKIVHFFRNAQSKTIITQWWLLVVVLVEGALFVKQMQVRVVIWLLRVFVIVVVCNVIFLLKFFWKILMKSIRMLIIFPIQNLCSDDDAAIHLNYFFLETYASILES